MNQCIGQWIPRWTRTALLCAPLLLLAGCASTRLVDSDVQSFSQLRALPAPPTYRFERTLSQQAQPAQQDLLEAQAAQALAKVGMQHTGGSPAAYRVQVEARMQRELQPYWYDPWDNWYGPWGGWGWGLGLGTGWGGRGGFYGGGLAMRFPPPTQYRREVMLVLREAASGSVVYETRAVHDGIWNDSPAVFAAMLDAALTGFPVPPAGPRRVNVEIPR